MKIVLDASALLAWLFDEQGGEAVEGSLSQAAISTLNWSEVLQKSLAHGVDIQGLRQELEALGLAILPFTAEDAEHAAQLWTSGSGLSLADRACLVLGIRHSIPVWTADRFWAQSATGAKIHLIR